MTGILNKSGRKQFKPSSNESILYSYRRRGYKTNATNRSMLFCRLCNLDTFLINFLDGYCFHTSTQDGLNRYDGYSFKVFRHDPNDSTSISYNFALRLFVDTNGNIWVGTSGGGLDRYDPKTNRFRRFVHEDNDPNSLSDNTVYRIYEDHHGVIWVATANGLNQLDRETHTFRRYFSDPHNVRTLNSNLVSTMFEDSKGRFWVGGSRGVALYHRDGTFTRILGTDNLINCIFEENNGSLVHR